MPDPIYIAKGLTGAQRVWLLHGLVPGRGYWSCLNALIDKGLRTRSEWTPLGLAVRAALQEMRDA